MSGTFQNVAGGSYGADYTVTNDQVKGSLGRNLAGGARTATVPLIVPQTVFEDRFTRLDLRTGKRIRLSERVVVQANVDFYNLLNGAAILALNTTYGPQWLRPQGIAQGRLVKLGAQLDF